MYCISVLSLSLSFSCRFLSHSQTMTHSHTQTHIYSTVLQTHTHTQTNTQSTRAMGWSKVLLEWISQSVQTNFYIQTCRYVTCVNENTWNSSLNPSSSMRPTSTYHFHSTRPPFSVCRLIGVTWPMVKHWTGTRLGTKFEVNRTNTKWVMISTVPSVSKYPKCVYNERERDRWGHIFF
jgi:hypothetical protein